MKEGGRYYFLKNDGLQNQAVLYRLDTLDGEPKVLIDPNKWSKDGTIALQGVSFSDDGKYAAYGRAEAGSDWATWQVMEIESGKILPEELKWTKFTHAAWTKDGRGFFYSRFEEPQPGAMYQALNFNNKLYYHKVGTPQSDDVLVYFRPEHPDWLYSGEVSDDGRYLVITIELGSSDRYRIAVKDLAEMYAMPVEIIDNFDNEYTYVGNDGPVLFFKTDLDAPRRRLIAIDLHKPKRADWREIVPQAEGTLTQVSFVADRFIASYLKDVLPQVKVFRHRRPLCPRRGISRHRRGDGFCGQADRHRDVLHVLQFRHAAEHLSLQRDYRHQPPFPPGGGENQSRRLRSQAGFL